MEQEINIEWGEGMLVSDSSQSAHLKKPKCHGEWSSIETGDNTD